MTKIVRLWCRECDTEQDHYFYGTTAECCECLEPRDVLKEDLKEMKKELSDILIYLAGPYAHKDPRVRVERFKELNEAAGWFLEAGFSVFSPISQNHSIIRHLPQEKFNHKLEEAGWDFWKRKDLRILKECDAMVVLCLEGWSESTGVRAGWDFCKENNIPSYILNMEEFNRKNIINSLRSGFIKEPFNG